jgi:hypothetical protein
MLAVLARHPNVSETSLCVDVRPNCLRAWVFRALRLKFETTYPLVRKVYNGVPWQEALVKYRSYVEDIMADSVQCRRYLSSVSVVGELNKDDEESKVESDDHIARMRAELVALDNITNGSAWRQHLTNEGAWSRLDEYDSDEADEARNWKRVGL